jgi:D-alanyl-D-alanine carboxypeptidase/D-alanyl-D-alanine-endopeptidase (penicillin-binding protein 4)
MKTVRRTLAWLAGLCLVLGAASAAWAPPPEELSRKIDAILGAPGLKNVLFSVCVVRAGSGELLYERNPRLALLPASNMKIVTSAVALERLGRDFAFETRAGLCGDALVIIGAGDPLLGDRDSEAKGERRSQPVLRDLVARLKEAGVTALSDIRVDTSIFDSQRVHPSWPANQLHQKYACEVSGLNYNCNCVDVAAANEGGRIVLSMDPPNAYIRLVNAVVPRRFGPSQFSVDRTGVPGQLLISGNVRTQAGPYAVAVENPGLFFGHLVEEAAVKAGIKVSGRVLEGPAPEGCELRPVAEYRTALLQVLTRADRDSLGLAAEALFKRLGAQAEPSGRGGSWESGRRVVREYLAGLGLEPSDFTISDGSGLSRDNRLSAWALTRLLMHLAAGPSWEFFKSTLAVGGLDGTIEGHFWEKAYRGRVQAKSGYIMAVRALSGVAHTDSGDYLFSFLANQGGNGSRTAIDNAVKAIIDWGALPRNSR